MEPKFDLLGITSTKTFNLPKLHSPLKWLDKTIHIRRDIKQIFPWAKTILIVGLGYDTDFDDTLNLHPDYMSISKYAILRDYHKVIPKKLRALISFLQEELNTEFKYKIHSDTLPVFEKGYAQAALGGITGYNNLWHSPLGTFVLLGGVITSLPLKTLKNVLMPNLASYRRFIYESSPFWNPSFQLSHSICPKCHLCIKNCPTKALLPNKFILSRCIGYWTAEHKGLIPINVQKQMKNILFGCDICQNVCTFNRIKNFKLSRIQLEERFGKVLNRAWHISVLKRFSVHGFYKTFAGTPVMRMRFYKFIHRIKTYTRQRESTT